MNQPLLSKRLAVESFKLIPPLVSKSWNGLWLSKNLDAQMSCEEKSYFRDVYN